MRRLLLTALLIFAACGDNRTPVAGGDAAVGQPDAGVDGAVVAPCALDRPGTLERPPEGGLPCDLLPPGFAL